MEQEEKNKELYRSALNAFFTNEIEADKIILGLSVAIISFYAVLFLNQEALLTELMFISSIASIVCFGISAGMVLLVFKQNKKQLLSIILNSGVGEEDPHLSFLDRWKYLPFFIGLSFSIIFLISVVYNKLHG